MSEAMVRGVVHLIEETKTFGQKGFRKRLVVLEQAIGSFTNYVPLEFVKDGCDTVDDLNVGDEVEVRYRLNGRKWQKDADSEVKFFLNAEALDFKLAGSKGAKRAANPRNADPDDLLAEAANSDDDPPF